MSRIYLPYGIFAFRFLIPNGITYCVIPSKGKLFKIWVCITGMLQMIPISKIYATSCSATEQDFVTEGRVGEWYRMLLNSEGKALEKDPVNVYSHGNVYHLCGDGHARTIAAIIFGLEEVPAYIRGPPPSDYRTKRPISEVEILLTSRGKDDKDTYVTIDRYKRLLRKGKIKLPPIAD
ncbi:hypothetical protein A3K63_05345 [Candidatus Micrarchaeota archaeon RBG_16_49_10]|nr:MAG: hypothetical protein A3K63_05345 [Candidatus Micrarchaeota archaeon RBG_16_49_10]